MNSYPAPGKALSVRTAPVADFTVTPASGDTNTDFQFDASGSSDNEDSFSQLRFSWDWEDDGNWDMENSTNYTPTHKYSAAGAYDETTQTVNVGSGQPVGIDMIFVQGDTFQMGDTWGDGDSDEKPVHTVTVNSFYMGKYEVTNAQVVDVFNWALAQGKITASSSTVKNTEGEQHELLNLDSKYCQISYNGSQLYVENNYDNYPVIDISWYGAAAFCNYLSEKEGYTTVYDLNDWSADFNANGYRLPTEAEWEYAAKGGANGNTTKYSGSDNVDAVAWYWDNSDASGNSNLYNGHGTLPVGNKQPNELGIYDMSGNVWEWCNDWYDSGYYSSSPSANPTGPSSGSSRVLRGGSWRYNAYYVRVAYRGCNTPNYTDNYAGFRLLRTR